MAIKHCTVCRVIQTEQNTTRYRGSNGQWYLLSYCHDCATNRVMQGKFKKMTKPELQNKIRRLTVILGIAQEELSNR